MITKEKLKIYNKYLGNFDIWVRSPGNSDKVIQDNDWQIIDDMCSDIQVMKNGLASTGYAAKANEKIRKECDSEKTIDLLVKTAEKQMRKMRKQ